MTVMTMNRDALTYYAMPGPFTDLSAHDAGVREPEPWWSLIRLTFASPARLAMVQAQAHSRRSAMIAPAPASLRRAAEQGSAHARAQLDLLGDPVDIGGLLQTPERVALSERPRLRREARMW